MQLLAPAALPRCRVNNASVQSSSMDNSVDGYSNSSTLNASAGEAPATFKHVDDDLIDYEDLCKHSSEHGLESALFMMTWILAAELLLSLCAMCVQRKQFFEEDYMARNPYDANYSRSPAEQQQRRRDRSSAWRSDSSCLGGCPGDLEWHQSRRCELFLGSGRCCLRSMGRRHSGSGSGH